MTHPRADGKAPGISEKSGSDAVIESNKGSSTVSGLLALPETERKHIWEIEHRVLLLDFRFWPMLADSIRALDQSKMQALFAPTTVLEWIDPERIPNESIGFGQISSGVGSTTEHSLVSLDEFIKHIFEKIDQFDLDRRVNIRTVFLSPADRDDLQGAWRGRFLLRVWGKDKEKRPRELVLEANFELSTLTDEVPIEPHWLTSCKIASESVRQSEQYMFQEVGKSWGLDPSRFHDNWQQPGATPHVMTGGVYVTDYDLDGQYDLFVTDIRGNVLYHQVAPGKFEDVTWLAGLDVVKPSAPVAWADLDGDSYPDLIAGTELLRNTGRGTFERAGVLDVSDANRIHGYAIADYDRDGRLDIYVARLAPDPLEGHGNASWLDDRSGPGNSLLHNLGGWKFEEVTAASGTSAGTVSCLSAAWLDANEDLWPDLFVGDEFGSPVLLVNQRDGTFASRTITGDFGGFNMGVATGDLDNDGRIDLYLANMYSKAGERVLSNLNMQHYGTALARRIRHIVDGCELWHNCGDLQFESKGRASGVARVGWSYGPRIADFDNDGMLDIYAPAGFLSITRDEPDG